MLLLIDLDNTLVDREAAFARWAGGFVAELGGTPADLDWLIRTDADGYAPRDQVADAIRGRFGLRDDREFLVGRLMREHVELIELVPGVRPVLETVAARGIGRVIVTNGTEWQQRRKLEVAGLNDLVDDVIISESVGCKKPDPRIFRIAIGPRDPATAWMIGDDPDADVRGAAATGMRTGWVDRGRGWAGDDPPTVSGRTAPAVIAAALAAAAES